MPKKPSKRKTKRKTKRSKEVVSVLKNLTKAFVNLTEIEKRKSHHSKKHLLHQVLLIPQPCKMKLFFLHHWDPIILQFHPDLH